MESYKREREKFHSTCLPPSHIHKMFVSKIAAILSLTSLAAAATLQRITDWGGSNPTNLLMDLYVPDNIGPNPAVVLG